MNETVEFVGENLEIGLLESWYEVSNPNEGGNISAYIWKAFSLLSLIFWILLLFWTRTTTEKKINTTRSTNKGSLERQVGHELFI